MSTSQPLRPFRILVIGNYSGRNAGDAAILDGLLRDVTEAFPDRSLEFHVPTVNPRFIRRAYPGYPVKPVGLLPWNLSLKILGLPIVRAALWADLILVTDAVLFDLRLRNPLFNYLHTLSWVLPMASRRGVPVVVFNATLGMVRTDAGRRCLTRVLGASQRVVVRDPPSAELARTLAPHGEPPLHGADSALSALPAPPAEVDRVARAHGVLRTGRPVLGFNVNAYLEAYLGPDGSGIRPDAFQAAVAQVLDRAIRELGVEILLFQTHPMDAPMVDGVLKQVRARDMVGVVRNPPVGHRELTGLLGRAEAVVSMRTHGLILASRMRTPVGGLIAYAKSRGYLESIGLGDRVLEFRDFDAETLWRLVEGLWNSRRELRRHLEKSMPAQEAQAAAAAGALADWLGPPATLERAEIHPGIPSEDAHDGGVEDADAGSARSWGAEAHPGEGGS